MTITTQVGPLPEDVKAPADGDTTFWSVTTIIGALEKPALVYWSAEQTALAAVHEKDSWEGLAKRSPDDAVEWLKSARFRRAPGARSAAELGTAVHAACEEYALTGIKPEVDTEVTPFLEQFDQWCDRFQPAYQAVESTVYNKTYGYAGTCDAFLTVGGVHCIVDYKTSSKSFDKQGKPTGPYPEVALQLAAYRHAEFVAAWRPRRYEQFRRRYYLLSPAEEALAIETPEVDTGLVIHISPQHCVAYPVECGPDVFDAFLYVQESFRWVNEQSKTVIGRPLEPEV